MIMSLINIKKIAFVLSILVIPVTISYSQWRLANGTEGIFIWDVEIYYSNPDTVYALGSGLMLSSDRGENWKSVASAESGVFKIDPYYSKRIYLNHAVLPVDGNEVKMTNDGGLNWISLFVGRGPPWIDAPIVETDPVDLTTVYVTVNYHRLYRSSDHGNNWDSIPPPSGYSFSSLAIAPSNNNLLYIGCYSPTQVFKSTDRGQTWTLLPFPLSGESSVYISIHPEDADIVYAGVFSYGGWQGGIYKSINGGLNWEEKNNGLTNTDWDINTVTINPKSPNELYIGTGGDINLFRSTNGSEKWTRFDNGLPQSGHVRSIAIDTLNNRIYIGRSGGLYIFDKMTRINNNVEEPPEDFLLHQNYPNPFNSNTIIQYQLPKGVDVKLTVYDILGKKVVNLVDAFQQEGLYQVELDATGFTSGIYIYSLVAGQKHFFRKAVLIK
jgi:photosystem II stability/assembly factor-like uncharacterized protein